MWVLPGRDKTGGLFQGGKARDSAAVQGREK
jgi:hypothetical protein